MDPKKGKEDEAETWKIARGYADQLGKVPTSFQTTIRTLLIDQRANPPVLGPASHFLVTRFLRGRTMKALFYYATLTFHGEEVSNTPYLSSSQLIRFYGPGEMAAMIAVIYAYRRIRRKAPEAWWQKICASMVPDLEIGTHLGMAIPAIGSMVGVLAGGMPGLAQGMFLLRDPLRFQSYWKRLEAEGGWSSGSDDQEIWGCGANHVAAGLLQTMGLSVPVAHALYVGLSSHPPGNDTEDPLAYSFGLAREWIAALREKGAPPDRVHKGRYYPLQTALHRLLYRANRLREHGCEYRWLERTKDDVSVEKTPQLFQEALLEAQNTGALKDFYKEHLPEEILSSLSEEELAAMSAGEEESAED